MNMRQGPNGRRPRSRHHNNGENRNGNNGGGGGGNMGRDNRPRSASSLRHQSFDSNCGDLRVRGNAWQVHEKYQALARDASSGGDRVAAENYLQHAEHYFRIIEAINEATATEQRARGEVPTTYNTTTGQPETPSNFYGGGPQPAIDGNIAQPVPAGQQPPPQAEATVQSRTPPSPFFSPEEIDEHNGGQPLAAVR